MDTRIHHQEDFCFQSKWSEKNQFNLLPGEKKDKIYETGVFNTVNIRQGS